MRSVFVVISPLPVDAVRALLATMLSGNGSEKRSGKPTFHGAVTDAGFWLVRNLGLTERTLPLVATGRFEPSTAGTTVRVSTRPQGFVIAFLVVWSGFWAVLLGSRLLSAWSDGLHWGEIGLVCGFIVFGWLMVFITSTIEERLYHQALKELLATPQPSR